MRFEGLSVKIRLLKQEIKKACFEKSKHTWDLHTIYLA